MMLNSNRVNLLFKQGISMIPIAPNHTSQNYGKSVDEEYDYLNQYYTPLGCALIKRDLCAVKSLLTEGEKLDHISLRIYLSESSLDLYFYFTFHVPNLELLKLLLNSGAPIHSLKRETVYKIAVCASCEELDLLLKAGLDPNYLYKAERMPREGIKQSYYYTPEINLLDLAVASAIKKNLVQDDLDSYKKVALLLDQSADPHKCNNHCEQNFFHRASDPELIKLFADKGVNIDAKAFPVNYHWEKEKCCPIELAYTDEMVDTLCLFRADRSLSPYLKDTEAHKAAIGRIGSYNINVEGLVKAHEQLDIQAFIALLGEDVDVNQRLKKKNEWTCLHKLFSKINRGSVCLGSDYINSTYQLEIQLINMLIKHGAQPLKDAYGRTPLMCLFPHAPGNFFHHVVKMYSDFEALYYGLDPNEYQNKIFKLRGEEYERSEIWFKSKVPQDICSLYDQFWKSFADKTEFIPLPFPRPPRATIFGMQVDIMYCDEDYPG